MEKQRIREILDRLAKAYPEAKPALRFVSPFELLIATILSAQCTDKRVNIVTAELFKRANTPEAMADMQLSELEDYIRTCGLYQTKARNIHNACIMLRDHFGSQVPSNREELIQLPGVGRKTANVVLAFAFGQNAIAVDTHVLRVSNRIGLAHADTPDKAERQLMDNIPPEEWSKAHHYLIYLGRQICSARAPKCGECFLNDICKTMTPQE